MKRVIAASSIVVVVALAALVPGSGRASSGAAGLPAGLAAAIHARLGAGAIRSSSAASSLDPSLGFSVALSADGTTALVGAYGVAGGMGAAYIFHASDAGSWTSKSVPTATLTGKHGTKFGFLGFAVALSADGTTAFVGAPLTGNGLLGAGAIYVFHASAEDAWASSSTPKATLTVGHGVLLVTGLALTPDGTTLVAGSPFSNNVAGGAFVFHASSESAWTSTSTPVAALTYGGESPDDHSVGASVAISADGTTALASDDSNPSGGGAFLYHVSAADAWASSTTPTAILSDSNSSNGDFLGGFLALSPDGTLAVLGTYAGTPQAGYADIFHSSGEAAWASTSTPTATLLPPAGGSSGSDFGSRVAVSSDGMTVLVTAPGVSKGRGAAYIFRASGEGAWASSSTPTATLTNSGGHPNDELGLGVVLSADGATALVGAPFVDKGTGAVDVFHVAEESSWTSSSTPNATLTDKKLAACVVPRLKGLKLPAAKSALAVGRCRLGKVTKVHSTRKRRGRVLSQNHKPRTRLAINAKVAVKVGK
ncbi:MAG TPA: PASTA domain-containing protein [Gaiellaceae bacterium]|nr:PASTA domain-containing protein [Gaiellaceae bacterium]